MGVLNRLGHRHHGRPDSYLCYTVHNDTTTIVYLVCGWKRPSRIWLFSSKGFWFSKDNISWITIYLKILTHSFKSPCQYVCIDCSGENRIIFRRDERGSVIYMIPRLSAARITRERFPEGTIIFLSISVPDKWYRQAGLTTCVLTGNDQYIVSWFPYPLFLSLRNHNPFQYLYTSIMPLPDHLL